MEIAEIRKMDEQGLIARLREYHQESFNLRFQRATLQLENTARIRLVKKGIARIMTVLREREMKRSEV